MALYSPDYDWKRTTVTPATKVTASTNSSTVTWVDKPEPEVDHKELLNRLILLVRFAIETDDEDLIEEISIAAYSHTADELYNYHIFS